LLGARANDGILVWNATQFASETNEESFNPVRETIVLFSFLYRDMLSSDRRADGRAITSNFNADTGSRG
jgi:hypothetical protein